MHKFLFLFLFCFTFSSIPNNHLPNGIHCTDILMVDEKKKISWIYLSFHLNFRCNFFLSAKWMELFISWTNFTSIPKCSRFNMKFSFDCWFRATVDLTCIIPTKIHYVFLFFYIDMIHPYIFNTYRQILVRMKVQCMAVLVMLHIYLGFPLSLRLTHLVVFRISCATS